MQFAENRRDIMVQRNTKRNKRIKYYFDSIIFRGGENKWKREH